jgi:hypothetical protein
MRWIDSDERQMPMSFARMNSIHLFEDRKHRAPPFIGYRIFDHLHRRWLIRRCTGRQPQCDAAKTLIIVAVPWPMALPPNARAKRGNASKYCCGSGHAHRQGGSQPKAKVSAAKHRSVSGTLAVRMNGSDIVWHCPPCFVSFVARARALLAKDHGPRSRPSIYLVLCLNATIFTNTKNRITPSTKANGCE